MKEFRRLTMCNCHPAQANAKGQRQLHMDVIGNGKKKYKTNLIKIKK
jgi:hypothetical protein